MRLKRLEIHGFKSFSERSELAFDKGVTAIVGPNGCGKSNVADAITWVMGEQSAKSLRGERMEDVLFSGSDGRKPTATAEVRLRFAGVMSNVTGPAFPDGNSHPANEGNGHENGSGAPPVQVEPEELIQKELIQSVGREVEVTRRLYRSGESEYLIDGRACRLRDVAELLMDTGLGAKAYAIIEQGKIDRILSSRPTDRRQLIEEAAGVTKYRARRRSAELKLDAALQNLTRVNDIVFEIEKQRGALRRQAAKARRYQKLRSEQTRWEKVLFAGRHRQLAEAIESTRVRLADARAREAAAAARVGEVESDLERLRIELVEAEARATSARETAHAHEIAISRLQQQGAFDTEQIAVLTERRTSVASEFETIEARRGPGREALAAQRQATVEANAKRDQASSTLLAESEAYQGAHREIEGLEADVEAARNQVFSAINSATALRHSLEHAATARERVAETLSKLQVETEDVRIQCERVAADHESAAEGLRLTQAAGHATSLGRAARESELAGARIERDRRVSVVRTHEQELAGLEARLKSLEELQAARADYGDAARVMLAQANGQVGQRGAVADYLEVAPGYERAVDALLGDLLQHVIVEQPEQAEAGLRLVRERHAGRCGFVVAQAPAGGGAETRSAPRAGDDLVFEGAVALSSVLRVNGPYAAAIRDAAGEAWIAGSYELAVEASRSCLRPIATVVGDLFLGPHVISGGIPEEARGILETRGEINELKGRLEVKRQVLVRLADESAGFEATLADVSGAIAALDAEHHTQEKAIVSYDAQLQRAAEDRTRLEQRSEQLARERRQAEEERDILQRRQTEAQASVTRLEGEQLVADEGLTAAQRRLFELREAAQELGHRVAEAGASHAALVERASALAADVQRMEEASTELELRATTLGAELEVGERRIDDLRARVSAGEAQLDAAVQLLETMRGELQAADESALALRVRAGEHEAAIKVARGALDAVRATVADLDVMRATAESDLAHLAQSCLDTVQASIDEVLAEVEAQQAAGSLAPESVAEICADEPADDASLPSSSADGSQNVASEDQGREAAEGAFDQWALGAEEAVARLRAKIDRLGPVNMMAIEQFDELDARHLFLTTQRKDLTDSIAQTAEVIKRIDEMTSRRFFEAFSAINGYFQTTFSALFGGGRAGLTLIDEHDPLESGIDVIAQPPGKRLQSVQLLSGGEKALTAIALMFSLFKYKPSPFCLLDEIDAPLDDANIGRFVEMLRGMQEHTQFILITHNRKTMEIADRLYGVTMEEPGVSKLISVQLN